MRRSCSSRSYDAPGVALGAAKQSGGRCVADDFLRLRVPAELPAQADGDHTKVPHTGRAMGHLGGRDGQPPRLHAVEEIANVIGRIVEIDLPRADLVLLRLLGSVSKPSRSTQTQPSVPIHLAPMRCGPSAFWRTIFTQIGRA